MNLLIDTHAFLWFLMGERRLPASARRRMTDPKNTRFLSIASVWEMAIKVSLGKLALDVPLSEVIERGQDAGIGLLGISRDHALGVAALPWRHRDPFDRLLVAQALEDDLSVITSDAAFDAYGVRRLW